MDSVRVSWSRLAKMNEGRTRGATKRGRGEGGARAGGEGEVRDVS